MSVLLCIHWSMCTYCIHSTPLQRYGVDHSCAENAALAAGLMLGGCMPVLHGMQNVLSFQCGSGGGSPVRKMGCTA